MLDAVGVSTGQDAQPFVQITPRLGSGNPYLEQGSSSGSVAVAAGTAALSLGGIETLLRNMSDALASAAACGNAATGLHSQLASGARMQMGRQAAEGPLQVEQALCGFFAQGEGKGKDAGETAAPMWGARLLSPTLGRCDTAGADPVCRVSFVLQSADGDVRVDGAAPVESYARALAFEVPALPGLACARVSQRNAGAETVTVGDYKPHAGAADLQSGCRCGRGTASATRPAASRQTPTSWWRCTAAAATAWACRATSCRARRKLPARCAAEAARSPSGKSFGGKQARREFGNENSETFVCYKASSRRRGARPPGSIDMNTNTVKVTALKNGPYKVEGAIDLVYDGTPVATPGPATFLCRCGASSKKPFCDGTHSKIGFQAAAESVPQSREG